MDRIACLAPPATASRPSRASLLSSPRQVVAALRAQPRHPSCPDAIASNRAHEDSHPLARAPREAHLLAAAEEAEAEPDDRVGDAAGTRDDVHAELHRAGVQPLPDLIVHLAHLEMALERPVAPAP